MNAARAFEAGVVVEAIAGTVTVGAVEAGADGKVDAGEGALEVVAVSRSATGAHADTSTAAQTTRRTNAITCLHERTQPASSLPH